MQQREPGRKEGGSRPWPGAAPVQRGGVSGKMRQAQASLWGGVGQGEEMRAVELAALE